MCIRDRHWTDLDGKTGRSLPGLVTTCCGSKVLKSHWAQWESLTLENGLLERSWGSANGRGVVMQLIVPRSKVQSVLKEMHDGASGCHLGVNKLSLIHISFNFSELAFVN